MYFQRVNWAIWNRDTEQSIKQEMLPSSNVEENGTVDISVASIRRLKKKKKKIV